ncbi:esterase [Streptomyces armeniacus]|uniref:Esterase n=1 Tax=Streptomyces armeniacus TaxID=83291 RepID=A0A345XNE4_9ACTN|nr:FG-GAP and VCBS repeat-containing protein [Streptomyces armeniacus]AXK33160.1 esterase [Streptomyces armeniacus]
MRYRPNAKIARLAGVAVLLAAGSAVALNSAGAAPGDAGEDAAAEIPAGVAPTADFNDDGFADHLVTAPGGTVAGQAKAGYVAVVYGSADGTDTGHRQVISQATEGVPGDPAAEARWGVRAVARDLDGDGRTDLAVGSYRSDGVTVLWGSPDKGLTGGKQLADGLQADGSNLVGGDFNGDGNADLISGSSENDETANMKVLYGPFHRDGQAAGSGDLTTDKIDAPTDLVAGDMTGDGADDLVSMHAFEEMSEKSLFWKGAEGGIADKSTEVDDAAAATVGDVDGDHYGDLVLRTVPGGVVENLPYDHGTLKVIYGSENGLSDRTATIDQSSAGVPGANEEGDQFGYALTSGDVNGDGRADIAVGVPYEDLGAGQDDTGAVVLLKGADGGLSGKGAQAFDQSVAGVPGVAEAGDRFGSAVSLQDTDGDDLRDLGVGTPGEDGAGFTDTGAAWVLRGADDGLTTDGVRSFGPGQLGAPEDGAQLGATFAR